MKNLRLKVCGLRDNFSEVIALKPDYAGFIFYEKSPRYVGDEFELPFIENGVKKVGVFVNEAHEKVLQLVSKHQLDYVQLHGDESHEYCEQLKKGGVGVIKAFPVEEAFDFNVLEAYESATDYFLFDTKTKGFGGSGKTFNWNLLNKYSMEKQYFLSGGIDLDNLDNLASIDLSKVYALDVNSRFEVSPGLKDIEKLTKLKNKVS